MSEAATAEAPAAPATTPPDELLAQLAAFDHLCRERGTSVTDLLAVVAKNAFGIADLR